MKIGTTNLRGLVLGLGMIAMPAMAQQQASIDPGLSTTSTQAEPGKTIKEALHFTGHVINSAYLNPIIRPVTSTQRLFFLVTDSALGFANRLSISAVRRPLVENIPVPPLADSAPMDLDLWEEKLDRITGTSLVDGKINLLVDGDEFFPALIEAINTASESVKVRTYIFDNDDYALEIADLLKIRSQETVVKVMLDGLGTLSGSWVDAKTQPSSHVPPATIEGYLKNDSSVKTRTLPNPWFSGDHIKSIVIDERIAFTGGMNIGREYRYEWHDLMMELRGPVVEKINRDFDNTWLHGSLLGDMALLANLFSSTKQLDDSEGYPVRLLYTRPHHSQIYHAQLAAIRSAQQYIFIQNAYFSDDLMLLELIRARRRGVDVRVIIPSRGDNGPMDRSNILTVNSMLGNGIRVYIYPGMSHIKAAIYDDWACLGTANFDKLSLRVNQEMNIATSHPEFVAELRERVFMTDFEKSTEVKSALPHEWTDYLHEVLADEFL